MCLDSVSIRFKYTSIYLNENIWVYGNHKKISTIDTKTEKKAT